MKNRLCDMQTQETLQKQFGVTAQLYYRKNANLYGSVSKKPSHFERAGEGGDSGKSRESGGIGSKTSLMLLFFLGSVTEHCVFE